MRGAVNMPQCVSVLSDTHQTSRGLPTFTDEANRPPTAPCSLSSPAQPRLCLSRSCFYLPTVAAVPGEKRFSQNCLKKDVFPTLELPTRTILKRRSGAKRKPSSCKQEQNQVLTLTVRIRWSLRQSTASLPGVVLLGLNDASFSRWIYTLFFYINRRFS